MNPTLHIHLRTAERVITDVTDRLVLEIVVSELNVNGSEYPCQDAGIHSDHFRQTLHGFSSDSDGTFTQHSQNLHRGKQEET